MIGNRLRVGARASNLSQRQTRIVIDLLTDAYPGIGVEIVQISTIGDRQLETPLPLMAGKGVFTEEIETALLDGSIDFAVHSLKDLPVVSRTGIVIGAVPERAAVEDMLISRSGSSLSQLPHGTRIGTSSLRRSAQLLRFRQDLVTCSIRGNVETRIRKALAETGQYDAIVLARAGLARLDLTDIAAEQLPLELMLPAPGQGALAVQCRDDAGSRDFLRAINHSETECTTAAERAFLSGLGGGCSTPVAAHGTIEGGALNLRGRVIATDGSRQIDVESTGQGLDLQTAIDRGICLAENALALGAADLLGDHE